MWLLLFGSDHIRARGVSPVSVMTKPYVVRAGDTLWSIASHLGETVGETNETVLQQNDTVVTGLSRGTRNTGETVWLIQKINGRDGKLLDPLIKPGQVIYIPED